VILLLSNNFFPPVVNREIVRGEPTYLGELLSGYRAPQRPWTGKEHVLLSGCYRGKIIPIVARELTDEGILFTVIGYSVSYFSLFFF
jgi:hypothetical protein